MTNMDHMLKELNRIANALERIADAWEKNTDQPDGKADAVPEIISKMLSTSEIV